MKFRKSLLVVLCAASVGAVALPASSATVYLSVAPPTARHEYTPAPRAGYLWVPGYWDVHGGRHAWTNGHWERQRRGHTYVQSSWKQHDNRWALERGRWQKADRQQ
jgi:hypothetical protein